MQTVPRCVYTSQKQLRVLKPGTLLKNHSKMVCIVGFLVGSDQIMLALRAGKTIDLFRKMFKIPL